MTVATVQADVSKVNGVTVTAYGLFPAAHFRLTTGEDRDCATEFATIPQALWFFRHENIALPLPGLPVAGFERRLRMPEDLRRWSAQTLPGSASDYPSLVWIGSPQVVAGRLDAAGHILHTPAGTLEFQLVPRLASNRSFYNAASTAFFAQREVRVRGTVEGGALVARTLWPLDWRLDPAAVLDPLPGTSAALRAYVRDGTDEAASAGFSTRLIWQRDPSCAQQRAGRPLFGLMLNGAQGDDDEAHGGHFGLLTGRVGAHGEMHDCLLANFYTLDTESEKGIISAMLPLDNYLADVNSGQAWYRPSWLLVATLRDARSAAHIGSALARVFNQFYRHQFLYHHATDNCAGICLSTLRTLGWRIPTLGVSSWWKAFAALLVVSLQSRSLAKGKAMFDYFSEERTRLFPAVAFEEVGADLLELLGGQSKRALTPFEAMLRDDVEEVLLVRVPQLPSSRAWGSYPVVSMDEYRRRLPSDPRQQQIVPVAPRLFPPELKDPLAPAPRRQRSDYALAVLTGGLSLLVAYLRRSVSGRQRAKAGSTHAPGYDRV